MNKTTIRVVMINVAKYLCRILVEKDYNVRSENVCCTLELSPHKRPMRKSQAIFFKEMKDNRPLGRPFRSLCTPTR